MIELVIEHFGGHTRLAHALGVSTQAVSQWVASGRIPPARAIDIERLTDGKFRALDISKGSKDDE